MPLTITQAPGGGTSIGQGLQQGLDSAAKDKMAIESLQTPGIREAMGGDVVDFITKGPGAHKRLGAYMAQADKLSGGKVTKMNRIVQNVSGRLEGRKDVPRDEVLKISLEEAERDNRANPQDPQSTIPEIYKQFDLMFPKGGAARPSGAGRGVKPTDAQKIEGAAADPAFKKLVDQNLGWESMSNQQKLTASRALGDSTMAKRVFSIGGDDLLQMVRAALGNTQPETTTTPGGDEGAELTDEEADRLIELGG